MQSSPSVVILIERSERPYNGKAELPGGFATMTSLENNLQQRNQPRIWRMIPGQLQRRLRGPPATTKGWVWAGTV